MSSAIPQKRGQRLLLWGLLVILLAVAAFGWLGHTRGWWRSNNENKPQAGDMIAALRANNRGIGYMEQYKYAEAVAEFEEVVKLAPDFLPGHINLGIALLNNRKEPDPKSKRPGDHERAIAVFQKVLQQEPDNPYAHFCLGVILKYRGDLDQAAPHFEHVIKIDPNDPAAWYYLGLTQYNDNKRASQCFRKAHELDRHAIGPLYSLSLDPYLRSQEIAKVKSAGKEFQNLQDPKVPGESMGNLIKDIYGLMGRYASVIGGPEIAPASANISIFVDNGKPLVQLAKGVRWATADDLRTEAGGDLRALVRTRFGGTMVVLDYNKDGKPDLLLLGAVVENGQVRNLLLRNEGDGHFADVTRAAGLAEARLSLGCCVADFDNDGFPDLFITGIGEQRLFRNTGKSTFEDITIKAGLSKLPGVCLGASFVDLDQDGDLDLVVAQYAQNADEALALLSGKTSATSGGRLLIYVNVGEALPVQSKDRKGLEPLFNVRFVRLEEISSLSPVASSSAGASLVAVAEAIGGIHSFGGRSPVVSVAASDLDSDQDLDLFVLADGASPAMILNDRLLRFHRMELPGTLARAAPWNGALVIDANQDGRSDLFLLPHNQKPILLLNQSHAGLTDAARWWEAGITNSPPLLQAQTIDMDLDGWPDIVGLSNERKLILLHNDGRRLVAQPLGNPDTVSADLLALTATDVDGDGYPDLVVWSEKQGVQLHRNQGNGNHGVAVQLTGRRGIDSGGSKMRTNADGFGAWITAQADELRTQAEYVTLSAGLGQSSQPLLLGLGRHTQVDVLRLRWPDNTTQAELDSPMTMLTQVTQANRTPTSCPLLFTWNGKSFTFVTDFLGAGSMGEEEPGGSHRPPRPEESVKIEADQFRPLDGYYVLKFAEPMDEVTYLDRLQLEVVDHPHDVRVYPDERFPEPGSPPSQDLLAVGKPIFPLHARDHRGQDVTGKLLQRDRDTVDDFAQRSWLGYAEDHWVELDFGDRLAKIGPRDRIVLCLAGWTSYPYPESIWAATQAGIPLQPPVLERLGGNGAWQTVVPDFGFPAGLPRMMTREVTGQFMGPRCVIRLRSNMEVYWDQIFVAPLLERVFYSAKKEGSATKTATTNIRAARLEVDSAVLSARGCMQEYSPDGRRPTLYDYDRLVAVPVSRLAGRLTRMGDVTELLRERDDRFVLFGPGDEVSVRFDARRLPDLPSGWVRSFVLRTCGYCKDCSPFTATGATVEPLPFRAMRDYPYGPNEHYPRDAMHEDYQSRFNTREVRPNGFGPKQ